MKSIQYIRGGLRQRGAALLVAMLIVALVASLASAASWQQWRNIQAETDERAQSQAYWLVRGALDWGKIILYLDRRATSNDHLNEPWALPLAEARLSTFLTADHNVSQVDANADMTEAFFNGGVADLQGRLNLTNLVDGEQLDAATVTQFERLFEALNLPVEQVATLARQYHASVRAENADSADSEASRTSEIPLTPVCIDQLDWLGLDRLTIERLRPYVTVLPARTRLNLNTAHELVLWAALEGADQAVAARLAAVRETQPFASVANAQTVVGPDVPLNGSTLGVETSYFLVTGRLRLDTLETSDRYVLHRDGNRLRTVRRECEQALQ